jgi:hypothetical protein
MRIDDHTSYYINDTHTVIFHTLNDSEIVCGVKQITLIGLNEHSQQIFNSQLVGKAVRVIFAVTVYALREL